MIMPGRSFSLLRMLVAALAFLFALAPLAAAPVLAGIEAGHPHGMTISGMTSDSDSPCAGMEDKAKHSPSKHAQNCLAQCLAAHGAVLPAVPNLNAAWHGPAALLDAPSASHKHVDASGIDPPPPRQA